MSDAPEAHVLETVADGVLTLTLNRPDKKNALTQAMYRALTSGFQRADVDDEIGAVAIFGAEGAFTAGNDLKDFMAAGPETALVAAMDMLRAVARMDTPLVACVDGLAIGVGATLMLHCDFAFATARSQFKTPFIDLALVPEAGSSLLAPQRLGPAAANRLLMLGHTLDAQEAAACGLITAMLDDPVWEARTTAKALADKPRAAMRETKRLMRAAERDRVLATIDREAEVFVERLKSAEAQAVFKQFFMKSAG